MHKGNVKLVNNYNGVSSAILLVESQKSVPWVKCVPCDTYQPSSTTHTLEIYLTRESRIQQPHENGTLHHF